MQAGRCCRVIVRRSSGSSHKCIEMDVRGRLRLGRMSLRRLRERTHAPLRDLLQLGLSNTSSDLNEYYFTGEKGKEIQQVASTCVLPREKGTLVHFGGLKAIIGGRAALFFDANRPSTRRIVRRIAETDIAGKNLDCEDKETMPFELGVLEGILREACNSYQRRLRIYERAVERSIDNLMESSSKDKGVIDDLYRLGSLEAALSSFAADTEGAEKALVELLANDEDMVGLLVSERERERNETNFIINVAQRHVVVELLLESYHRRIVQIKAIVHHLRAQLLASRDLAKVAIDVRRNNIIRFNLYLSTSSLGLALTTCVTSVFGMNLLSGLEDIPGIFFPVGLTSCFFGLSSTALAATALHTIFVRVDLKKHSRGDHHLAQLFSDVAHLANYLPTTQTTKKNFSSSITPEHMSTTSTTMTNNNNVYHFSFSESLSKVLPSIYTHNQAKHRPYQTSSAHSYSHLLNRKDLSTLLLATNGRSPSKSDLDIIFDIFDPEHTGKIHVTRLAEALLSSENDNSSDNNTNAHHLSTSPSSTAVNANDSPTSNLPK